MWIPGSAPMLLSALLCTNFVCSTYAQSLDRVLRAHNLTLFADFFRTYPPHPALLKRPHLVVYAPTNDAMQAYFDAHGITLNGQIPKYILRRDDARDNAEANIQLSSDPEPDIGKSDETIPAGTTDTFVAETSPSPTTVNTTPQSTTTNQESLRTATTTSLTTLGTTPIPSSQTATPTGTVRPTESKRALEERALEQSPPPQSWLAKIYSGNGHLSYVVKDKISFEGGVFYTTDRLFQVPKNFTSSISESGFTALQSTLNRIPDTLAVLQNATRVTFLAPCPYAFKAAANQLSTLSPSQLQSLFDYHTIVSGFVGYTPTLKNGKTYRTKSGLSFVVTFKNNDIYINDAKIISRNQILKNGVIQVLDKFLVPPPPGATTVPGPDGPVPISDNTIEVDNPTNPNPEKPSVTRPPQPVQTYAGWAVSIKARVSLVAGCLVIAAYFVA